MTSAPVDSPAFKALPELLEGVRDVCRNSVADSGLIGGFEDSVTFDTSGEVYSATLPDFDSADLHYLFQLLTPVIAGDQHTILSSSAASESGIARQEDPSLLE